MNPVCPRRSDFKPVLVTAIDVEDVDKIAVQLRIQYVEVAAQGVQLHTKNVGTRRRPVSGPVEIPGGVPRAIGRVASHGLLVADVEQARPVAGQLGGARQGPAVHPGPGFGIEDHQRVDALVGHVQAAVIQVQGNSLPEAGIFPKQITGAVVLARQITTAVLAQINMIRLVGKDGPAAARGTPVVE